MKSRLIVDKTEVVAKNGIVTAMHPLAAEAGLEILQRGGKAADAAVAAAFSIGVVEPFMSGLGGHAVMMVYDAATGRTTAIDGGVAVPRAAREDMFELLDPSSKGSGVYGWRATKDEASESGFLSVCVPGAVAAYTRLLEMFGTMPLREVMAPAIRLAAEGFPLDWYVFATCAAHMSRLRQFPETMSVFFRPDGTPFLPVNYDDSREPDRLVQADLARTLELIAQQGAQAFYGGEIGRTIAHHVTTHGGILSESDLAQYRVRVSEPPNVDYRGYRVKTTPATSGAPTVAQMLNVLEGFDLASLGHNSAATLHLIAEASCMVFADRFAYLADPEFGPVPLEGLASKTYAAERRRQIDPARGLVKQPFGNPWPFEPPGRTGAPAWSNSDVPPDGHTTHLSVIDRDGNMVALTASLGRLFGSGLTVPGTGVLLTNGMMWFDPEPGRANSIRPGRHAVSAATPTLVFDDRGPLMALGAPGERKVITAVLQALLNSLDFGMGMQAAISAPRIHRETGPIRADARLPEATIQKLREMGHEVVLREETVLSSYFARPNGVRIDRDHGVLLGGVEPYKVSTAAGF